MSDVVYARGNSWFPKVIRDGSTLHLSVGAGADANHDPRTFTVPIDDAQLTVIRDDLARHLLVWSVLIPLAEAAGTRGPLDEATAVERVRRVLLCTPEELDALFRSIPWSKGQLIAHGADIDLLERGDVWAAMRTATSHSDWSRVQEHAALSRRAKAGVVLSPLDTAILRYTGQYLQGGTVPKRLPDAVEPALLPDIVRVISTAEEASAGMQINRDPRRGKTGTDKRDWDRMTAAVETALKNAYPELAAETVRSVTFLMTSEAAARARSLPIDGEDDRADRADRAPGAGPVRERTLLITDDKGGKQTWNPDSPITASAAFWGFVAERSSGGDAVFIFEDEAKGEGVQFEFNTDAVVRVTTMQEAKGDADPEYYIEYALVDGLPEYRALVRDFVEGGCAALDGYGPWMTDPDEFDEARRRRLADK
jgi:hypothetical protein